MNLAQAQNPNWNLMLNISPNPSPLLSAWQSDPRILMLTVNYYGKTPITVTFQCVVTGSRFGAIATAKGNTTTIQSGPQTRIFHNTEVLNIQAASFQGKLPDIVKQTGRLPEDDYTLCISILDQKGTTLATTCATFSISLPDQPQLVMPLDKDTVSLANPIFQWTPVLTPPQVTSSICTHDM